MTTEFIDKNYSGDTQQIRIKKAIKEMYDYNGTRYVLLGGDADVIPVQYCSIRFDFMQDGIPAKYNCDDIPADVYYSCLEGDFNWDTNGDGLYGTYKDDINILPSVFVSRVPVNRVADVKTFVDRILEYEKSPSVNNSLLQAGTRLDHYFDMNKGVNVTFSAVPYADELYYQMIGNNLIRHQLFDDYSNLDQLLNKNSFSGELIKGHQFIEVMCHGEERLLCNDDSTLVFMDYFTASTLKNPNHTIFTTTACRTNSFDNTNELCQPSCLSETLMHNPNSGIVGYLGSSRLGWYRIGDPHLECSFAFENQFYKNLFNDNENTMPISTKSMASLLCLAKFNLCTFAYRPKDLDNWGRYKTYRWLFYSINAIGDPETPIYSGKPNAFTSVCAEYNKQGLLEISTGLEDAKVCVSNADEGLAFYEVKVGDNLIFDTGYGKFDVWITKQNYYPWHGTYTREFDSKPDDPIIGDDDLISSVSVSPNPASSYVDVTYSTRSEFSTLSVAFSDVTTGKQYTYDITYKPSPARLYISDMPSGIYVVNLIENGQAQTSTVRLIKQ